MPQLPSAGERSLGYPRQGLSYLSYAMCMKGPGSCVAYLPWQQRPCAIICTHAFRTWSDSSHHNISQSHGDSWISRMNSIHPSTRRDEALRIFWRSTPHTYLALGKPQAKGAIGFHRGVSVSVSLFFSVFWSWDTTSLLSLQPIVFTNIIGYYLYRRAKYNALSDQVEAPLTLNWASSSTFVLHIQYVRTTW